MIEKIIGQEHKALLVDKDHQEFKALRIGPTNKSSNLYVRSETVNLTQFSDAFVPCNERDNILTGGYLF